MTGVRPAAVAGMFYPSPRPRARGHGRGLLTRKPRATPGIRRRRSSRLTPATSIPVRSPHAAYARLAPLAGAVRRVVLIGPAHRRAGAGAVPYRRWMTSRRRSGGFRWTVRRSHGLRELPQVRTGTRRTRRSMRWRCTCRSCRRYCGEFRWSRWSPAMLRAMMVADVLERLWGGPETADRRQLRSQPLPRLCVGAAHSTRHQSRHRNAGRRPLSARSRRAAACRSRGC